jgi:hypothetical protein
MNDRPVALVLLATLALASLLAGGCAQTTAAARTETWQRIPSTARVLLMTPDIELAELSAGGVLEPKAEWTERARALVVEALRAEIGARNARLVPYQPPGDGSRRTYQHDQLRKLHDAVGQSILVHHYGFPKLPNKDGKFDWTLGEGVSVLREDAEADYALFVFVRDSYASAGRKAAMVGVAILSLGRAVIGGGVQVGFASLVDLKTGDLVWFNRLIDPQGDLRDAAPAREAVKKLLADLPL